MYFIFTGYNFIFSQVFFSEATTFNKIAADCIVIKHHLCNVGGFLWSVLLSLPSYIRNVYHSYIVVLRILLFFALKNNRLDILYYGKFYYCFFVFLLLPLKQLVCSSRKRDDCTHISTHIRRGLYCASN